MEQADHQIGERSYVEQIINMKSIERVISIDRIFQISAVQS